MIYQLAKTTPLLSGQVKINLILNGNRVKEVQYVPISESIPFNYNSPQDVLNYSHGENIKKLYEKISDQFYSSIGKSSLSPYELHRYEKYPDDTHDSTYEMGMKRMSYQRYNKQFSFFCPIWANDPADLDNLRFEMCFAHARTNPKENPRVIFSKFVEFDDKTKAYFKSVLKGETDLEKLVYIGFKKMESNVYGISVESGNSVVHDSSYIMPNLVDQERPLMETDNMIASIFSQKKMVARQLLNFNFVFDIDDILPIDLRKQFVGEMCNVYFNVYRGNEKAEVKDFYTNYDSIPRYSIAHGKYIESFKGNTYNVLDYMQDNLAINLVDKNKLVQSTFHWALLSNPDYLFNLYNGFAPVYVDDEESRKDGSSISSNDTDLYADGFNLVKNPLGIFKYNCPPETSDEESIIAEIENSDNFYTLIINPVEDTTDGLKFGNLILDKIGKGVINSSSAYKGRYDFAVFKVPVTVSINTVIRSLLESGTGWSFYRVYDKGAHMTATNLGILKEPFILKTRRMRFYRYKVIVLTNDLNDPGLEWIYFNSFVKNKSYNYIVGNTSSCLVKFKEFDPSGVDDFITDPTKLPLSVFNKVSNIIDSILIYPSKVTLSKSVSSQKANSPDPATKEIDFVKSEKQVVLYRYGSNLVPMFISIDDSVRYNRVYWVKQYDRTLDNALSSRGNNQEDFDDISSYVDYSGTKFAPEYPSIGYYPLHSYKIDYEHYYFNETSGVYAWSPDNKNDLDPFVDSKYIKEKEWFKNNSLFYLPQQFTYTLEKDANDEIGETDFIDAIKETIGSEVSNEQVSYYIKNLYSVEYKTDYLSPTNIDKQIIKMKFTLK